MRKIDYSIIGKQFGRLTVISLAYIKDHSTWWNCKCDCGKEVIVYRGSLTSGDTISCGCYHKERNHEFGLKHGLTKHPLYHKWSGMIQRCTNPNSDNYSRYGGRGITVCDEWLNDFKSFYDWSIQNGYKDGLTIDRIDNEKGYAPDNCRWITKKEQYSNLRRNHNITYNGVTHTLSEWARVLNINRETLRYRVNHGNYKDFENL